MILEVKLETNYSFNNSGFICIIDSKLNIFLFVSQSSDIMSPFVLLYVEHETNSLFESRDNVA